MSEAPPDDLASLAESLRSFDRSRQPGAERPDALLRLVVRIACASGEPARAEDAEGTLAEGDRAGLPEARACLLCSAGPAEAGPDRLEALETLAAGPLWGPVRALVLRALAW